jgi:hypothetical protein
MKRLTRTVVQALALGVCLTGTAQAEAIKVEATMSPKEQTKLDFKEGSGHFKGLKGAGILHIKAVSPADRRFSLEGEVVPSP